jgi:hypothetical protein
MASVPDLCQLSDVKTALGITLTTDDALIQRFIDAASRLICDYVGTTFPTTPQSVTETRNGTGGTAFPLRSWPVLSIVSVTVDGEVISPAPDLISPGWLWDGRRVVYLRGYCFHRGIQNCAVSLTWGWTAIPEQATEAAVELAAWWYKRKDRPDEVSKILAQQNISYSQKPVPPTVQLMLDQLRTYSV